MKVSASLNSQCALARDWQSRHLPFGVFRGVKFFRTSGGYVAENLDPVDAAEVLRVDFVSIEIISQSDQASAPADAPGMPIHALTDEEIFGPSDPTSSD